MVNIEIDGKKLKVPQGAMVIEVADNAGIPIPRFCYHKKLSIAANCRMCLVQVEKAPKPLPACATPVSEGMKIFTQSDYAKKAQKAVMEFLLINHPLDCPICDQGGQCELQDVALEYGESVSEFEEGKRSVKDKDIGPLIETEMTRCIHCTRCVRFGDEVAGLRELGATGRGEHMEIGTYIEHSVASELSGNVIELCPVGALTSKPFRFKARAWEISSRAGIGQHDALGSHLFHHIYQKQVVRSVPRENEALNEVWLSDKDRFSYEGLYVHRLTAPQIKKSGQWQTVSWEDALKYVSERLQAILYDTGADQLGALASSSCTVEELYLLRKLMQDLGSPHKDHRLSLQDNQPFTPLSPYPGLDQSLENFEKNEAFILIGCHPRKEMPLLNQRIFKATKHGSTVLSLQSFADSPRYPLAHEHLVDQGDYLTDLLGIIKGLHQEGALQTLPVVLKEAVELATFKPEHQAFVEHLKGSGEKVVLIGQDILSHPQSQTLQYIVTYLTEALNAHFGVLSENANAAGAWLSGMVPDREKGGLSASELFEKPRKAMLMMNIEPEKDFINPLKALEALKKCQDVICLTPYVTESMRDYATVMLPMTPATETDGTFVNLLGQWQSFRASALPYENAKPAWKILRVLGNLLHLKDYEYNHAKEVCKEAKAQSETLKKQEISDFLSQPIQVVPLEKSNLMRLGTFGLYNHNGLLRRAKSLQETVEAVRTDWLFLNPNTANKMDLAHGDQVEASQQSIQDNAYMVALDKGVPENCALAFRGTEGARNLNAPFSGIIIKEIEKG